MAQHIWRGMLSFRYCEFCGALQTPKRGQWLPRVGPICPGDPDGGGGRTKPPKPQAPAGSPKVLEPA